MSRFHIRRTDGWWYGSGGEWVRWLTEAATFTELPDAISSFNNGLPMTATRIPDTREWRHRGKLVAVAIYEGEAG